MPPAPSNWRWTPYPDEELPELPGPGPWLAVAPGSGQPRKNWPLAHYYEVSRALGWEYGLKVVWLAGPGEEAMLPYLEALAQAQGQLLLAQPSPGPGGPGLVPLPVVYRERQRLNPPGRGGGEA